MAKDLLPNSKINKSIGLLENFYIDKWKGLELPFTKNIVFIKKDSNRADLNYLKKIIKDKAILSPKGTFVCYDLKTVKKIANYWELFDRLVTLSIAISILTKKACVYRAHIDYNESGKKIIYYSPKYTDDPYFPHFSENDFAKFDTKELSCLKKIFEHLDKLNLWESSGQFNRLKNGINFYHNALNRKAFLLRLIDFFVVLESLFSDSSDKSEIAYKICLRTSYIVCSKESNRIQRKDVFDLLSVGYLLRSSYLHGGDVERLIKKKKGISSYTFFDDYLPKLRTIVEKVLENIIMDDNTYRLFSAKNTEAHNREMKEFFDNLVLGF